MMRTEWFDVDPAEFLRAAFADRNEVIDVGGLKRTCTARAVATINFSHPLLISKVGAEPFAQLYAFIPNGFGGGQDHWLGQSKPEFGALGVYNWLALRFPGISFWAPAEGGARMECIVDAHGWYASQKNQSARSEPVKDDEPPIVDPVAIPTAMGTYDIVTAGQKLTVQVAANVATDDDDDSF
jgi:hypothetical protein